MRTWWRPEEVERIRVTVPSGWAGNILVAVSVSVLVIKKSAGKGIEVISFIFHVSRVCSGVACSVPLSEMSS